jgi:DNA modification methylase
VRNRLILGNPLLEMAKLPSGSVDLIYLPVARLEKGRPTTHVPEQLSLFEDAIPSLQSPAGAKPDRLAVETFSVLAGWIEQSKRLLSRTGNLYVHCTPGTEQPLREILNKTFSEDRLQNEIIWHRRPGSRAPERPFAHAHDVLLLYSNSEDGTAHAMYLPERAAASSHYRFVEPETGRRYALSDCTSPRPTTVANRFSWQGHLRTWRWSREHMEGLDRQGRLVHAQSGFPRYKRYLDQRKGSLATSVWDDIPDVAVGSAKPEALLGRIVGASTNPNDVVLVPNCEQGMTLVAAERQGRRWIGIDSSHFRLAASRARLQYEFGPEIRRKYSVEGMPSSIDEATSLALDDPHGFACWFLGEVGAEPSPELRSSDPRFDGRIAFEDGGVVRVVACAVRTGAITAATVSEMESTRKRLGADAVVLLSLKVPSTQVRAVIGVAPTVKLTVGRLPRVQLLTIHDIFSKKHSRRAFEIQHLQMPLKAEIRAPARRAGHR